MLSLRIRLALDRLLKISGINVIRNFNIVGYLLVDILDWKLHLVYNYMGWRILIGAVLGWIDLVIIINLSIGTSK